MNTQSSPAAMTAGKFFLILACGLGVGIVHDLLFMHQPLGLNYFLFMAIFLVGYFALDSYLLERELQVKFKYLFYAGLVLLFSFFVMLRDSGTLTFVNVLMSLFMLFMMINMRSTTKMRDLRLSDYILTSIEIPLQILVNFFEYVAGLFGLSKGLSRHKNLLAVLRGVVVAIPFLIMFILLFASADLIFGKMLANLFRIQIDPGFVSHTIDIGIITAFAIGTFYLLTRNLSRKKKVSNIDIQTKKTGLNGLELSVVLAAINVLFLVFIVVQVTYLFGGAERVIEAGFTYSQYARKGFFELLAVAVISFLLLYGADGMMKRIEQQSSPLYRAVASFLSVQVLVIMVSSFYRLFLYESAYGFTELRFYSHSFTIWLGVIFLLFLYKLNVNHKEKVFAFNAVIALIVYVIALNIVNPNAFIVSQNIDRYNDTGKLDTYYWAFLSLDAVPAALEAKERFSDDSALSKKVADAISILETRTDKLEAYDWRSFNISRSAAINALKQD